MLNDLAIKFIDGIAFRVAIVNDSVKVVKLAVLALSIEAGQVICSH